MTREKGLSYRGAELLMAGVLIARSFGSIISKLLLETTGTFNVLTERFLLGFLLLLLLFAKKLRNLRAGTLLRGLILGVVFFAVMALDVFCLNYTEAAKVSFLENTAIVIVPLFEAVLCRRLPKKSATLCALLALAGVALLSGFTGFTSFRLGESLALLAAVLYAIGIILTNRFAAGNDPLTLGIIQVGTMGILSLVFSLILETPHLPLNGKEWFFAAVLAVVCTGFGFTLQPTAQKKLSSERASMFCALSPVSVTILGIIFLKEIPTVTGIIGSVLILSSLILSSIFNSDKEKTA